MIKAVKKDFFSSFAKSFIVFSTGLILLPLIIYFLQEEELGFYFIFLSISTISSFFDFGFNPTFSRYISYVVSGSQDLNNIENKNEKINLSLLYGLLKASKTVYLIIGVSCFVLLLVFGSVYIYNLNYTINFYYLTITWIIYLLGISFNILFGYFSVFLRGIGRIFILNQAYIISKFIQIILTFFLLLFNLKLIGIGISYLLSVFFLLCYLYFYYKKTSNVFFPKNNDYHKSYNFWYYFNLIFKNTSLEGLISVSNYLLFQSGTFFTSIYLNLTATGILGLAFQITGIIANISSSFFETLQPSLQSSFVRKDFKSQQLQFSLIISSLITFSFIGYSLLFSIGLPFISLIKSDFDIPFIYFLLAALFQFLVKIRNSYASFLSSMNNLSFAKSFIISTFFSIFLSFISLKFLNLGIPGIIMSQIFSQSFNLWFWPKKVHSFLKIRILEMFIISYNHIKGLTSIK
jgi:O-antigen/teichoic acid export membrane protein